MACCVCREGYRARPREMLGVYCFVKRVDGAPGAPDGVAYTSVSHFNAIHLAGLARARAFF